LLINQALKKVIVSPWFSLSIRLALGLIFVYAGFIKLIDPKAFAKIISHYDIVPESFLPVVAIGLPALEFLSGLGLIFNIRGSLAVISSLLIMFSVVLGYGIFNDLNIDCGCFTPEEINQQDGLKLAFYRDLILIGGAFFLFLSNWYSQKNAANRSVWNELKFIKRRF
jgi:uncharacterized membrane protein YphA (DoxX/SURF4 family)